MRIDSLEARSQLARWVRQKRRVRCVFETVGIVEVRSGFLWDMTDEFVTIRQFSGNPPAPLELHVGLTDSSLQYFDAAGTPPHLQPGKPLDWFEGVIVVTEAEMSEAGSPIEMTWAISVARPEAWAEQI